MEPELPDPPEIDPDEDYEKHLTKEDLKAIDNRPNCFFEYMGKPTYNELEAKVKELESWKQKWINLSMEDAKTIVRTCMFKNMPMTAFIRLEHTEWMLLMVTMVTFIAQYNEEFIEELTQKEND